MLGAVTSFLFPCGGLVRESVWLHKIFLNEFGLKLMSWTIVLWKPTLGIQANTETEVNGFL